MLNYLWAGMILTGILFGAFNGKMPEMTNAALESSQDAVTLCITMIGVMAFWCGIMEIASQAGDPFSFSATSARAQSRGTYCHEFYRKCARAWLGSYPGRTEGDDRTGEAGG